MTPCLHRYWSGAVIKLKLPLIRIIYYLKDATARLERVRASVKAREKEAAEMLDQVERLDYAVRRNETETHETLDLLETYLDQVMIELLCILMSGIYSNIFFPSLLLPTSLPSTNLTTITLKLSQSEKSLLHRKSIRSALGHTGRGMLLYMLRWLLTRVALVLAALSSVRLASMYLCTRDGRQDLSLMSIFTAWCLKTRWSTPLTLLYRLQTRPKSSSVGSSWCIAVHLIVL